MQKIFNVLIFIFLSFSRLDAQVFPHEGSKLCYRLIGFSVPAEAGVDAYKFQIAKGNITTDVSFSKKILTSLSSKKNKIIAEVPFFGCEYTWRTISYINGKIKTTGPLHYFSVKTFTNVDTTLARLKIGKQNSGKYKNDYMLIDGTMVLYDMKGKPVWFLPGADLAMNQRVHPRDLKVTPQGTITFITHNAPFEINYNGDILWQLKTDKNNPNIPVFHHEFTRLKNGHYMGLIYEDVTGHVPPFVKDSVIRDVYDSVGYYRSRLYNSIVEYDESGRLVWRWSGLDYINNSDLRQRRTADVSPLDHDLHENAFFFNEKDNTIYLSFRNISRIVTIKYPEGNVLNTYGTLYEPGNPIMDNSLFCYQHSCNISKKGELYLYNNNICGIYHIPTIVILSEGGEKNNELKRVWEYQCTVEGSDTMPKEKLFFHGGGCVNELPDESLLVMMGAPYSKAFIVNKTKEILWSAIPEKYNPASGRWEMYSDLYRASVVTRKELEQLIWNAQK